MRDTPQDKAPWLSNPWQPQEQTPLPQQGLGAGTCQELALSTGLETDTAPGRPRSAAGASPRWWFPAAFPCATLCARAAAGGCSLSCSLERLQEEPGGAGCAPCACPGTLLPFSCTLIKTHFTQHRSKPCTSLCLTAPMSAQPQSGEERSRNGHNRETHSRQTPQSTTSMTWAAGRCAAGTRELSLRSARSQETAQGCRSCWGGSCLQSTAVPTRSLASGYSDQLSTPPACTSAEQAAFTFTLGLRRLSSTALVRLSKKMQGPSPSNNPALPSSPRQQKGPHGAGHSLGNGTGDCGSCTERGHRRTACRMNGPSTRSGCGPCEEAFFPAAPSLPRTRIPHQELPLPSPTENYPTQPS